MNSSSAHKERLQKKEIPAAIRSQYESAVDARRMRNLYAGQLSAMVEFLADYDKQNGTDFADEFRDVPQSATRKDPAPILIQILEQLGPMEKKDLAERAQRLGGGRGKNEARQRGSCGSAIEQMINATPSTLRRLRDGKIALP